MKKWGLVLVILKKILLHSQGININARKYEEITVSFDNFKFGFGSGYIVEQGCVRRCF